MSGPYAEHGLSTYALAVLERGEEVLRAQIRRLENTIALALAAMKPHDAARLPLEMVDGEAPCVCRESMARRLDRLSGAVVAAQRLVSHEARASAILFLDESRRDLWTSYGDYRRSCDSYLERLRS